MSLLDKRLTELDELLSLDGDEIIYVVDDPSSTKLSRKMSLAILDARYQLAGVGDVLPVSDDIEIVKGSIDDTKLLRFEVDGFAAGNTRVLTPQDQDGTIALLEANQVFTQPQKINVNSDAAFIVEQDGVNDNVLHVDTANRAVGINNASATTGLRINVANHGDPVVMMTFGSPEQGAWYFRHESGGNFLAIIRSPATTGVMIGPSTVERYPFGTSGPTLDLSSGIRFSARDGTVVGVYSRIVAAYPLAVACQNVLDDCTITSWGQSFLRRENTTTAAISTIATVQLRSTGTPTAGFGPGLLFQGETDTTEDQSMARVASIWNTAIHASRSADIVFETAHNAGALTERFRIKSNGALALLASLTSDAAPSDDTTQKKLSLQKLAAPPTNAAYIAFSNNPGSDTFYLVLEEA